MRRDGAELGLGGHLPDAHEDQVQYGFRMISAAFSGRVQVLEQELRNLKNTLEENKNQVASLQRKNSSLEAELVEGHQRTAQLSEENKELFKTVQQLRKQLVKLEGLKKRVLESVTNDDAPGASDHEESFFRGGAFMNASAAMPGELRGLPAGGWAPASSSFDTTGGLDQTSSPRLRSSWPSPAAASTRPDEANSSAVIDGKQFFRQARNSLSYEAFSEFLSHIKRLNNQQQSREETLEHARRIFGAELEHLYREFEQLLNRHGA